MARFRMQQTRHGISDFPDTGTRIRVGRVPVQRAAGTISEKEASSALAGILESLGQTHRMTKAALIQRRSANRMGENEAWQEAVAETMAAVIVGHDSKAFDRLGDQYDDSRGQQ
jgi:hypothetical protein